MVSKKEKERILKILAIDVYLLFRDYIIKVGESDYDFLLVMALPRGHIYAELYADEDFRAFIKHLHRQFDKYIKDNIDNKVQLNDRYKEILLEWWLITQEYKGLDFVEIILSVYLLSQFKYPELPILQMYFERIFSDLVSENFVQNTIAPFFNNKYMLYIFNIVSPTLFTSIYSGLTKPIKSTYCKLFYGNGTKENKVFVIRSSIVDMLFQKLLSVLSNSIKIDGFTVFKDFIKYVKRDPKVREIVNNVKNKM